LTWIISALVVVKPMTRVIAAVTMMVTVSRIIPAMSMVIPVAWIISAVAMMITNNYIKKRVHNYLGGVLKEESTEILKTYSPFMAEVVLTGGRQS